MVDVPPPRAADSTECRSDRSSRVCCAWRRRCPASLAAPSRGKRACQSSRVLPELERFPGSSASPSVSPSGVGRASVPATWSLDSNPDLIGIRSGADPTRLGGSSWSMWRARRPAPHRKESHQIRAGTAVEHLRDASGFPSVWGRHPCPPHVECAIALHSQSRLLMRAPRHEKSLGNQVLERIPRGCGGSRWSMWRARRPALHGPRFDWKPRYAAGASGGSASAIGRGVRAS